MNAKQVQLQNRHVIQLKLIQHSWGQTTECVENKGYPWNYTKDCYKRMLDSQQRIFCSLNCYGKCSIAKMVKDFFSALGQKHNPQLDLELFSLPFTCH